MLPVLPELREDLVVLRESPFLVLGVDQLPILRDLEGAAG